MNIKRGIGKALWALIAPIFLYLGAALARPTENDPWLDHFFLLFTYAIMGWYCVLIYMFPSIIAWYAHKENKFAIAAVNLFFGWTLIGWVAALVWALHVSPVLQVTPIITSNPQSNEIANQ